MPSDLPPHTWAEAIDLIRQHDPETAEQLNSRYVSALRLFEKKDAGFFEMLAVLRLGTEALDLYEQLRKKEVTDAE